MFITAQMIVQILQVPVIIHLKVNKKDKTVIIKGSVAFVDKKVFGNLSIFFFLMLPFAVFFCSYLLLILH